MRMPLFLEQGFLNNIKEKIDQAALTFPLNFPHSYHSQSLHLVTDSDAQPG